MAHESNPLLDRFLATADAVGAQRPEVDLELAREVFEEAATLLHNGLVLDGLDEHDRSIVVDALCADLVSDDPGTAMRERAQAALDQPEGLNDHLEVHAAYLMTVATFQL